jgi:hypothetical protein
VLSKCNQELLIQISSILENSNHIKPNSIEFQTLELPGFVIQILSRIVKNTIRKVVPYLIPNKFIFYLNFFNNRKVIF